jgi:hypothetical protein
MQKSSLPFPLRKKFFVVGARQRADGAQGQPKASLTKLQRTLGVLGLCEIGAWADRGGILKPIRSDVLLARMSAGILLGFDG